VVTPGYGWAEADASSICVVGFYNPGYNNRVCSKCPGGLTTAAEGSTSTAQCKAPAGSYYLRGRAIACAQGTYKANVANADCDECAEGLTTAFGEVGKTDVTDCATIKPGYSAASGQAAGSITTEVCPADTYRAGELAYDSADGIACTPCGTNSRTMPNVEGAISPDACLAPPGYGWNEDGSSTICEQGFYNPGWNREACTKCGEGSITTAAEGSASPDQCYTPAGHGNKRSADGLTLTGFACPVNTYGRGTNTTGLVDVECTKCMEHTSTEDATAQTNVASCVADAGYGYYDGEVKQCEFAYYSAAGGRDACEYCGLGYNTTDDTLVGIKGADSEGQCDIAAGWEADGAAGVKQCARGYYKPTISNVACDKCLSGTTTSLMAGAIANSDCDTCRPGFGGAVDVNNPSCTLCTSGYYSPGYTPGGQDCVICPNPESFSGKMVSRNVRTGVWGPACFACMLRFCLPRGCCRGCQYPSRLLAPDPLPVPPPPPTYPSPPANPPPTIPRASSPPRTAWASLCLTGPSPPSSGTSLRCPPTRWWPTPPTPSRTARRRAPAPPAASTTRSRPTRPRAAAASCAAAPS
jgi:hypothetical protein